jgi:hypothetical protein
MAREVQVFLLCDPCLNEEDVRTEGDTFVVAVGNLKPREIVMCERHYKELLQPLHDMLPDLPTTDAVASPQPSPDEPQSCRICGKTHLKNLQTLQGHVRNMHGMKWRDYKTQYLGEEAPAKPAKPSPTVDQGQLEFEGEVPDEFKCNVDGCDKVYDPREYGRPLQALAVHKAKVHGIAGAKKGKR